VAGLIGEALALSRSGWRPMLKPLLLGAVLPSLPVTGCILQAHAVIEAGVADGKTAGLAQALGSVVLVILLPIALACGLLVTGSWIRAARSADPGRAGPPPAVQRKALFAYMATLVGLMAAGAAAPHLISANQAPIDLEYVTAAGLTLAYAGPGLLTPIAFLATIRTTGIRSTPRAGLAAVTLSTTACSLAIGLVLYGLTDILQAGGFVLLMALAASLLTVPLAIFSISAGLASTAAASQP
jgi:hypothetical protein